jgi:hypothetical protein
MKQSLVFLILISGSFCLSGQSGNPLPMSLALHTVSKGQTDNLVNSFSVDTLNSLTPVPDDKSGKIRFPNAFRWNRTGPTGGFWSENQVDDYTFRPVFENIASYKLQIFSRRGMKIFDSSDVYKGWDGYLGNGGLALQGVYIWKASGKFFDGKEFDKTGDVTFIY